MNNTKYIRPSDGKVFSLEMVEHQDVLDEKNWTESPVFISDDCMESLLPSQVNVTGSCIALDIDTMQLVNVIIPT